MFYKVVWSKTKGRLGDALELARRSDVLVMTVQSTAEGLQPAYDRI